MSNSTSWYDRALATTPLASQTRSKGPAAYGGEPMFATWANGARIVASRQGYRHEMIDWVCGLGAVSLGYRNARVDNAVTAQLGQGVSYSLPHYLEVELGERLREIIPCMKGDGMVRFVKTGSEACEAAVRIARKATGRDLVLTCGYHGWHSSFQAANEEHPGVPDEYGRSMRAFKYNDEKSFFLAAFNDAAVAAIILEPTLFEAPAKNFLESLRNFCTNTGAVLIFDEMVTGFRLARAGGQERFGVIPDLATYGKGMANGMPLACVCGKRELMEHADVVSGTFGGEALSLAAAMAVLNVYAETDVCGHMETIGGHIERVLHFARQSGAPIRWEGWPQVGRIVWDLGESYNNKAAGLFSQVMAAQGVLWHPRIWYVSYAHTVEDTKRTAEAMDRAFGAVCDAATSGDWSALIAEPETPFARKP